MHLRGVHACFNDYRKPRLQRSQHERRTGARSGHRPGEPLVPRRATADSDPFASAPAPPSADCIPAEVVTCESPGGSSPSSVAYDFPDEHDSIDSSSVPVAHTTTLSRLSIDDISTNSTDTHSPLIYGVPPSTTSPPPGLSLPTNADAPREHPTLVHPSSAVSNSYAAPPVYAHARTAADAVMLGHGRRTLVRWRDRWRALTCTRERDAAAERYARRRLLRRTFFHVWLNAHGDASSGERPTPPGSSGARDPDAEILRLHDRA